MAVEAHRQRSVENVVCGVITVSDTRTEADDRSGALIRDLLSKAGHRVVFYRIVKDEPVLIVEELQQAPAEAEVVICNGGTGLSKRDRTYEAIQRLFEKELTGFGELFRMLSYEQVGAAAMLSRATAGIVGRRAIFSLPGSTAAVELAMTKLILPELGHIVALLRE